jgi:hypothetical protein
MKVMTYTKEQLEDYSDQVKIAVMRSLVNEKFFEQEQADEWCENHTVVLRSRSIFRTITQKWLKSEKTEGDFVLVVKKTF